MSMKPDFNCATIHAGSVDADPAKWRVTHAMLEWEIEKGRAARVELKRRERAIGFGL
jgi:hypothetical protein